MSRAAPADSGTPGPRDVRCHCGNLVARITDGKVEIKCRRCQRLGLIDIRKPHMEGEEVEVQWTSDSARTRSK